ncbi:MAG: DEAD/DEAH box helicase family protein, partial [Anaerolineae bacterium]|nr:DEAD/DEAH box helicase family protein [Anaerolineae bacterium]
LYADGLEREYGRRPVIFYTNGYDIYIWDDAQNEPPRRIYGFYSKDSLQYLHFQREQKHTAGDIRINYQIVDRLYQIEAIKRIVERFDRKHRKGLLVQATGTGKTRVAIALCDALLKARWVKRILFLCDRRELRKQAKNAFQDYIEASLVIVSARTFKEREHRIYMATYPAMKEVYQSFDV